MRLALCCRDQNTWSTCIFVLQHPDSLVKNVQGEEVGDEWWYMLVHTCTCVPTYVQYMGSCVLKCSANVACMYDCRATVACTWTNMFTISRY